MTRGQALYLALLSVLMTLAAVAFLDGQGAAPEQNESALAGPREDAVQGLWSRWPDRQREGDPLRFYYFHGDGHGLYRYGRIGHTNTHSFDYRLEGDALLLTFRKSGAKHRLSYRLEVGRDGRRVLRLESDPEENGATTSYVFVPPPSAALVAPRDVVEGSAEGSATRPAGRMWIDLQKYATGGMGFSIYQLGPAGIDGRGTGWHHRGDFDDWSTESLTYRLDDKTIDLRFDLTGERARTRYRVVTGEEGERRLVLHKDPRNWWHRASFADMGRSFAADIATASPPWAFLANDANERREARRPKGD